MAGASGGATFPFIYLHDIVLRHAETLFSPDKEVFTALMVFLDMTLLFIGN
jgi:hypothetical protein